MGRLFVTFEGIDRSGKTTQIKLFNKYLKDNNYNFSIYREPGGTSVSEKIRDILLDKDNYVSPYTELLLYIASRRQLLDEKILTDLNNKIVICDRYIDSTIVYQGVLRNISRERILKLHELVDINLMPDLTFLLDISAEESIRRMRDSDKVDRMEDISYEFIQNLRNGFLKLANIENKRFFIIDGTLSVEEINKLIIDKFEQKIKERTDDE